MALQKDFIKTSPDFSGQLIAKDVYFKVAAVSGNKESMQAIVTGVCNDIVVFNESYSFVPDLFASNFIAQAYKHLKTLPEFAGAEDC